MILRPFEQRSSDKDRAAEFGRWLTNEVETRGWTGRELARRMEVNASSVSRWMTGDRLPQLPQLRKLSIALGIPLETVMRRAGYDIERNRSGLSPIDQPVVMLPVYDQPAGAGGGAFEVTTYPIDLDEARHLSKRAYAFRVVGDCMEPLLLDGDLVIVDPELSARSGYPVVARIDDTYVIKTLIIRDGEYYLTPNNGDGEVHLDHPESQLVGAVVSFNRRFFRRS